MNTYFLQDIVQYYQYHINDGFWFQICLKFYVFPIFNHSDLSHISGFRVHLYASLKPTSFALLNSSLCQPARSRSEQDFLMWTVYIKSNGNKINGKHATCSVAQVHQLMAKALNSSVCRNKECLWLLSS